MNINLNFYKSCYQDTFTDQWKTHSALSLDKKRRSILPCLVSICCFIHKFRLTICMTLSSRLCAIRSDCPVTTQALDCNIHLCLYCRLFWGWRNVGVVYHCRHNRRMFWSTIWKWVELINSLCNTLCSQPCLCILIPTLLNCLNQTGHTLCNKYRVINIHQSWKKNRSDWWGEKILNLLVLQN